MNRRLVAAFQYLTLKMERSTALSRVKDSVVRLSQTGDWGYDLKQQVQDKLIEELVEQGVLELAGRPGRHCCFPASSLRRTRITLHLQRDLGVNLAGAALALDLLERIDELDARLRAKKGSRLR